MREHGGKSSVFATRDEGELRIETDDPVAELIKLQNNGGLREFRLEAPSLETVFLNLTGRHLRD
jgi:ABC-2 type transport system ATP-binding protein